MSYKSIGSKRYKSLKLHLNRYNAMTLKLGLILPVLWLAACATAPLPTTFQGQCVLQPIAAQDGLLLVNAVCEAK